MREYFPSLYGNSQPKKRLGDAVLAGKLPHAFMFVGPEGSGRRTLARELSMALNCEARDRDELPLPCGKCNTCRRIRENNFTDITYIKRESDKATIGVEQIRFYRDDMALSPNESEHKIYIIEEAERLTENAQNALLTVLEEPPASVFIMLICESADKILTTIKSRVQTISMQRFEADELKSAVFKISDAARRGFSAKPESADGLLMSADGRIGRAISLLSDGESKKSEEDRRCAKRIIDVMRKNLPFRELYEAMAELPRTRAEFTEALELLMCASRDLLLVKLDRKAPLLFYTSHEEAISAAKETNTKKLLAFYDAVRAAVENTGKNVSVSTVSADLAAKIKLL